VFFDRGNIVGVQTTVEREHIGRVLYQYGVITEQQHELTMERVRRGERYGESVVFLGYATREAVFRCLGRQVAEVFFACMLAADGTYFFLEGFDDDVLACRHTMGAAALLMDGVTRMDEVKYFRTRIPSPEFVPHRIASGKAPPEELARVYAAVDGSRSVEEIGRITGKGEFETTKQVYALAQSKHVEVRPPPAAGGPSAVMETANAILERLHDAVADAGQSPALRSALETFTVGAGMHSILFREAGPGPRGRLDADVVAGNLARIASDAPPIDMLKQLIEEYVGFALFTSEGLLGSERRQALMVDLAPMLNALRPHA
jgi:hypothetical protein